MLVRPLGALPQLLLMDLPVRKVSRAVFGLAVLVVAVTSAGIDWTPGRLLLVVVAPLAAVVFFGAVFVTTATVSFYWIDSGELANSVTYGGRDFTSYPVTIYDGWFRTLFAYGMGFAFVSLPPGAGAARPARPARPAGLGRLGVAGGRAGRRRGRGRGLAGRGPPLPEHGVMSQVIDVQCEE